MTKKTLEQDSSSEYKTLYNEHRMLKDKFKEFANTIKKLNLESPQRREAPSPKLDLGLQRSMTYQDDREFR